MFLLEKLVIHFRNGTLLERVRSKVSRHASQKRNYAQSEKPVGDTYYRQRAEEYLSVRINKDYWHLEQEVVRGLLAELPDRLSVLDVPFGTGRFVPYYLEKRMKIYGLDSSKDMFKAAHCELKTAYAKCNLELGNAENLPYESGLFDLVVCFRFLSHVVSVNQARVILTELNRVTNSKAILQLRVRRADAPPVPEPLGDEPINDRLDLGNIKRLLDESGFRVIKIEPLEEREAYHRSVFVCEKK